MVAARRSSEQEQRVVHRTLTSSSPVLPRSSSESTPTAVVRLQSALPAWFTWLMYGGMTVGVVIYLAGNISTALCFALLVLGILWPGSACLARLPTLRRLPAGDRVVISSLVVVLAAAPWFYLRRFSQPPALADAALCVAVWATARRLRAIQDYVRDAREALRDLRPALPFFCLPLLFGLVWAGFAVQRGEHVAFYGLYPLDFCNLVTKVSMILVGDGLPPDPVVGMVDPAYHWLYLTLPAWLVDVGGGATRAANALVLCDFVIALLFMLGVAQIVRSSTSSDRHRWTITATVAVILFAPLVMYAHQIIGRYFDAWWVVQPDRNYLLLSLVNSMSMFGTNTTALVMIVSVVLMLPHWNASGRLGLGLLICVLLALLPAYSATLVVPVALALAVWFLLGRIAFPVRAILIAVPVVAAAAVLLPAIHVLGGGQKLLPSFDRGQFLLTFGLSAMPLWSTALLAGRKGLRLDPWALLCMAGLAAPTFLMTTGSGTTPTDLSMKTCTLLIVSMSPFVARGVDSALMRTCLARWAVGPVAALLVCGLAHSLVYAGQFVVYRALNADRPAQLLPSGYDAALNHLRTNSSRDAVVLDTVGVDLPQTLWPASRAERRVLLPNPFWMKYFVSAYPDTASMLEARLARYRAWRDAAFAPGDLSEKFAAQSDYLILRAMMNPGSSWKAVQRFGDYDVYQSRRPQK